MTIKLWLKLNITKILQGTPTINDVLYYTQELNITKILQGTPTWFPASSLKHTLNITKILQGTPTILATDKQVES